MCIVQKKLGGSVLWFVLFIAILFGCQVGPKYSPPALNVPAEWKNPTPELTPLPEVCNWWDIFQDDLLDELQLHAIENNPNLFVALERIEEAWALAGVSRADLYPQINLNPVYTNTGLLFKIFLPNDDPAFANIIAPLKSPFRIHQFLYTFPLNLTYDVDLWGKYRSQYEAAMYNAQAEIEDYHTAMLSLTADVANSYFQLRTLDAMLDILQRTIAVRRKGLELVQNRYDKGLINYSGVASASLELANTEAAYEDTARQRGLQENILATLIGCYASDFQFPALPIVEEPPQVPPGIPSTIMQRRPDIAQAERTMASQNGEAKAAYANMFPSIQLTGTAGFLSPEIDDFFKWISRLWAIGANGNETIFDGCRKDSQFQAAVARFSQASGAYQQQVLIAFREVEDALNNLEYQKKQYDILKRAVEDATRLNKISTTRYGKGVINYTEVVVNERSELDAKQNAVAVLGLRYQSTIQLVKALGGGWDCPE